MREIPKYPDECKHEWLWDVPIRCAKCCYFMRNVDIQPAIAEAHARGVAEGRREMGEQAIAHIEAMLVEHPEEAALYRKEIRALILAAPEPPAPLPQSLLFQPLPGMQTVSVSKEQFDAAMSAARAEMLGRCECGALVHTGNDLCPADAARRKALAEPPAAPTRSEEQIRAEERERCALECTKERFEWPVAYEGARNAAAQCAIRIRALGPAPSPDPLQSRITELQTALTAAGTQLQAAVDRELAWIAERGELRAQVERGEGALRNLIPYVLKYAATCPHNWGDSCDHDYARTTAESARAALEELKKGDGA